MLGTGGMNRRTATVRAHGFTMLYVLFKKDLEDTLRYYPEDKNLLARKGRKAAKEVAAKEVERSTAESQRTDTIFPLQIASLVLKMMRKKPLKPKLHPQISLDTKAKNDDLEDNDDILIVEELEAVSF